MSVKSDATAELLTAPFVPGDWFRGKLLPLHRPDALLGRVEQCNAYYITVRWWYYPTAKPFTSYVTKGSVCRYQRWDAEERFCTVPDHEVSADFKAALARAQTKRRPRKERR